MINPKTKRRIVVNAVTFVLAFARRPGVAKMGKEKPDEFFLLLLELADQRLEKELDKAGLSVSPSQFISLSRMAAYSIACDQRLFYL